MFHLGLLLVILSFFTNSRHQTGINKTLGWIWDSSNWIYWFSYFNWMVLLGYGFLAVIRYKTNKYFSGTHLLLILFSFLIYELFHFHVDWIISINVLMIIVFMINFIISVLAKRKY